MLRSLAFKCYTLTLRKEVLYIDVHVYNISILISYIQVNSCRLKIQKEPFMKRLSILYLLIVYDSYLQLII